jgi:hypothetical protein
VPINPEEYPISDAAIVGPAGDVRAVAIAEAVQAVPGASHLASVTDTVPIVAEAIEETVVAVEDAFTVEKTTAPGTEIESGPGMQEAEIVREVIVMSA